MSMGIYSESENWFLLNMDEANPLIVGLPLFGKLSEFLFPFTTRKIGF
jgi:hypothetical protein